MKTAITVYITILLSGISFAQDYTVAIQLDADSMNKAFLKGDINTILDYTYPKVFELIGDRNYMAELISEYLLMMQEDGYVLDTATISSPGLIYIAGNELHTFITQTIYSSFPGGTLKNDVPLLTVSLDGGSHWYFIDMRRMSPDMINTMFPDYNYNLKIPEIPPPVIIYNDGPMKDN